MGLLSRNKKSKDANPDEGRRTTRRQAPTKTYSYYSARDTDNEADSKPSSRTGKTGSHFRQLPFYAAGVVILGALIYASTLSGSPKVVIVNEQDQAVQSLLRDKQEYQLATADILNDSVLNGSKLTINTTQLREDLLHLFPEAQDLSVVLPLIGRNPIIYLQAAQPMFVYENNRGDEYIVDENGRVVLEEPDPSVSEGLIKITDKSGLTITSGSYVLTGEEVEFLANVYKMLQKANIEVKRFELPREAGEIHVYSKGRGYYIKMTTWREGQEQVGAYLATKQELAKEGVNPQKYIDVRVEGRTYTK